MNFMTGIAFVVVFAVVLYAIGRYLTRKSN